ncbi:MAG TPA: DNRLRE domain-containing protein [Candidatus Dormibacteraeota bacterium]
MNRGVRWRMLAAAVAVAIACPLAAHAAALTLTSQRLTTLSSCMLDSFPSSAAIDADTYVQQGSPATNAGAATSMVVRSSAGANDRIYVSFNLAKCSPAIPAAAIIRNATLNLYVTAIPATTCRTLDIFKIAAAWSEAGITWNNQPVGASINNPPTAQRTSSTTVGPSSPCVYTTANQYIPWSVTADVSQFVAGSATNNGWMIRDDTEGSATARAETFTTREAGVLTQAPQLTVSYTLV